jgi:hypothetical protein
MFDKIYMLSTIITIAHDRQRGRREGGGLMRETQWIEWTRTMLQQRERDDLSTALTAEQESHLLEHDYVWVKKVGVLWKPTDGAMRRARFTHERRSA